MSEYVNLKTFNEYPNVQSDVALYGCSSHCTQVRNGWSRNLLFRPYFRLRWKKIRVNLKYPEL